MNRIRIVRRTAKDWCMTGLEEQEGLIALKIPGMRSYNGEYRGPPDAIVAFLERTQYGIDEHDGDIPAPFQTDLEKKLVKLYGLRPFQGVGVASIIARLTAFGGAILADDMGLGKTMQACVVADILKAKSIFVCCPAGVREHWGAEIQKYIGPDEKVVVLRPKVTKADEAEWDEAENARWVITSYKLANEAAAAAFPGRYADFTIIDEFQNLKGRNADRSRVIASLAATSAYRLGTTGSPIWNEPRDLYQQLKIIVPGSFGSGFDFDNAYCDLKKDKHGYLDNKGVSNAGELKKRLAFYMVRREKRDVAKDLPKVTRTVRWLPGSPKATGALHASVLSPSANTTYRALAATLEDKISYAVEEAVAARKFLLFTWEKKHAREIAKQIVSAGVDCELITGDDSPQSRNSKIADAKSRGAGVVATIDAAGVGVDGLQHVASVGIFHSIDFVPEKHAQAEARLDRIGQTLPVQWIYLAMRESMDEVVIHTNIRKLDQKHALLGGDRGQRNALDAEVSAGGKEEAAALRALMVALKDTDDWMSDEDG